MMNRYASLTSEINELESLIADIPPGKIIEKLSLNSRLKEVRENLASLPPQQPNPKASLTFRGKPILGSQGISAEFAAKATGAFSEAFSAVLAGLYEGLSMMGPIPNKEKTQLFITSTARGSFGFDFEIPNSPLVLFPELEKAELALKKIESLFRMTARGTDDDVAEIIEQIHPRAVKKVFDFLDILVQQQAWCGFKTKDSFFTFDSLENIKSSSSRLKDENIQESRETLVGEIQGVLPNSRTFEFRVEGEEEIIKGKIDMRIADPDILNREWLHKRVYLSLSRMQVGTGRARFTLSSLEDIKLEGD